jgi:hypothetical protein
MAATLLPPWPDELLVPEKLELAIAFLRGLNLPSRYASAHLGRWAAFLELELEPRVYRAVRGDAGLERRF